MRNFLLLCVHYIHTCLFSESYIYSPSCLPQTQKVVVIHNCNGYLLVCFGQLYNEIQIVRNRKSTQTLP